jgi:hypothetical protein
LSAKDEELSELQVMSDDEQTVLKLITFDSWLFSLITQDFKLGTVFKKLIAETLTS